MVRPSQRPAPSVEEKDMIFALAKAAEIFGRDTSSRELFATISKRHAN
jgi:hypothetical protein